MAICYQGVNAKQKKNNKTKESGVMFLSSFVAQVSTQTYERKSRSLKRVYFHLSLALGSSRVK